jgi:hypothetical protein
MVKELKVGDRVTFGALRHRGYVQCPTKHDDRFTYWLNPQTLLYVRVVDHKITSIFNE